MFIQKEYYLGAVEGAVPASTNIDTGWSVYGKLFLVSVTAALITEAIRRKIWKRK